MTYEHPLYRFIFLHRGRFVYCPFLLGRFKARRTTPEKKPSIRERLEDAKRECGSRKAPDKPAPQKKPPELGDL